MGIVMREPVNGTRHGWAVSAELLMKKLHHIGKDVQFMRRAFEKRPAMRMTARQRGETLVETLLSLFILALILSSVLQSASGSLRMIHGIGRMDACRWGAQWWFNRLPEPVTPGVLASMPHDAPGLTFDWQAQEAEDGTIQILLQVQAGRAGPPFSVARTF